LNSENKLEERRCKPCEGGVDKMRRDQAEALLGQIPGWEISEEGDSIRRRFKFPDFYRTMAFVNALAWIANQEDHHPDFSTGYNYCDVTYSTHAVDGLSENDFICAAQVNALFPD